MRRRPRSRPCHVAHTALDVGAVNAVHHLEALDRKHVAARRDGPLLIQDSHDACVRTFLRASRNDSGFISGNSGSPSLESFVLLGYRGIAQHFRVREVFEPAANRIVQMPSSHNHAKTSVIAEAPEEVIGEPRPRLVTCCFALRFGRPLIGSSTTPRSRPCPLIWPSTVVLRKLPLRGDVFEDAGVAQPPPGLRHHVRCWSCAATARSASPRSPRRSACWRTPCDRAARRTCAATPC